MCFLPLITARFGNQKSVDQMINMRRDRFVRITHLSFTRKSLRNFRWIGRRSDGRCKHIDKNADFIRILNFISFDHIFQIHIRKDILQII